MSIAAKSTCASQHGRKARTEKTLKTDVLIAKNYLTSEEMESLDQVVNALLDLAESEFEKYCVVQDRLFESDFDRMLIQSEPGLIKTKTRLKNLIMEPAITDENFC